MKLVNGINNYEARGQKLVLALGNFDGLHLAHRKIIEKTVCKAKKAGLKSAVFLLDPHPLKVLRPHLNILFLSSLEEKAAMLESLGIDYLVIEEFNNEFSIISPYNFVKEYLVSRLKTAVVVVGYDYTFGQGGKGSPQDLIQWSDEFNYKVEIMPPIMDNNELISSSLIRELITRGELEKASRCLGYYFQRKGKVVYGEGRGKKLGFPTANLMIAPDLLIPSNGVYLCLALWKERKLFGLTNIGKKPTFCKGEQVFVEMYLFDFGENIYGEELTVKFLHKIREERTFASASYLVKQIQSDIALAKSLITQKYAFLLKEGSF
ncbi:MAG: bifunctional riboflavin kinase/FAD synthetase [Dethiobacteria bacterium]|jgi:riboflavin kinase/FMN adenylyltransferase